MSRRILPGVLDSVSRGYNISGSSRFDSDKAAYFSQNFKYNGNQKTWTFSTWIKLTDVSTYQCIFSQAGTPVLIGHVGGRFRVDLNGVGYFETNEYFRDTSGWYHYMLVLDTTQSTAANRAKIFINGVQTSINFVSWTPALNTDYGINSAVEHRIGQYGSGTNNYLLKAYLAETHFIDGQALLPSAFGEINGFTKTWSPKKYSGTYGRNGFFLNHFKKAIKFDGRTTYYDTGVNTFATTNTWSLWIKPSVSGGPLVNKVSYFAFSTNDFPWQLNYNSNTGKIEVLIDSGNDFTTDQTVQSTGSQDLTDGNWHHIAVVTRSQNYVKIYIDGILDTNTATSVNIAPGSRNYFLGRDAFPYGGGEPGRFYNGSMADVKYFPSELSLGEVQSIYNTSIGLAPSFEYVGSDDARDIYYMSQITFNGSAGARRSSAPTVNVRDSKKGIISMWVDFTGGNGVNQDLWVVRNNSTDGNSLTLRRESNNTFSFRVGTGDATTYGSISSSQTITSSSGLTHLAVAWDLSISKMQMYVNGISTSSSPGAFTNANVDIANSPFHGIGGGQFNPISPNLQARVGQVYVNYGEFLDLSVSTNLNKFYNNGTPISLGSSGEVPTGNIPTFLLDGINITKNHGGGGDLDVTVGSFSLGATVTGAICSNRNGFKSYSLGYLNGILGTVTKDSPTLFGSDTGLGAEVSGNYATYNPLVTNQFNSADSLPTISSGNIKISKPSGGTSNTVTTFRVPGTGKWYWEHHILGTASNSVVLGQQSSIAYSSDWVYRQNGSVTNLTGQSSIATFNAGDIISIAYNGDDGQITILKNGTALLTNNGVIGGVNNERFVWVQTNSTSDIVATNFGATPYTYPAPAGYKSINTFNIPIPSIVNSKAYMDVAQYVGNGLNIPDANTVSGYFFQPDFVWIRGRSGQTNQLQNSTIGTSKFLATDSTAAEQLTGGGDISSFNADGFTLSYANSRSNANNVNYMGWMWKESGQSGFDIVTWTGDAVSGRAISHNLASTPKFIMVKATSAVSNWSIYHSGLTNATFDLKFTTAAPVQGYQFGTTPTSSVFYVGGSGSLTNSSGVTYIAYVFSEIPGFSSFGTYNGNGSTDGPFVHLGFRPSWFMIKNITSSEQWAIMDSKRPVLGNNNTGNFLAAQSSGAEDTNASFHQIDKVSNGFKVRAAAQDLINLNGHSYIYMAFAENPFKYALAR